MRMPPNAVAAPQRRVTLGPQTRAARDAILRPTTPPETEPPNVRVAQMGNQVKVETKQKQ